MNNAVYGKSMEKFRNKIDAFKQKKRLFTMDINTKLNATKKYLTVAYLQYVKIRLH